MYKLTRRDRSMMKYMGYVARIVGKSKPNGVYVHFDCSSKEEVERRIASIKEYDKVEVVDIIWVA